MSNGRIYTPEFKKKIVTRVDTEGLKSIAAIAADQELPVATVYGWVDRYGTTARQELVAKREGGKYRKKKRKATKHPNGTVHVDYVAPEDGGTASIPDLIMQYKQVGDALLRAGFSKEFLSSLT